MKPLTTSNPRRPLSKSAGCGKTRPIPTWTSPYTLVDTGGVIRCYVRPSKGVNLDRYLNRRVRVRGSEVEVEQQSGRMMEVTAIGDHDGPLTTPRRRPARQRRAVRNVSYDDGPGMAAPEDLPTPAVTPRGGQPGRGMPQPIPDDGSPLMDGPGTDHDHDDILGGHGPDCQSCGGCGHPTCDTCCHGFCGCGPPGRLWVKLEYLYWWTDGMRIPAP